MDELGHILREARETKGLTLAEVQAETRISPRYLEALESGEYDLLPTQTHVRGFLRNYARFLGLDPEPLLERYELTQSQRKPRQKSVIVDASEPIAPPINAALPDEPVFFNPVNKEVEAGTVPSGRGFNSESILRLIIIAALLVMIFLAAQRFIPLLTGQGDGTAELTEGITNVIEDLTGQATATAVAQPTDEFLPSSVLTSTTRNNPQAAGTSEGIIATPVPTRPNLPPMDSINLIVDVLERSFLEVTIDGDVVFTGIARADDHFEWEAQDEAKILTGNGAGIYVTINDTELGRLGERGENIEESWQTTN